MVDRFQKLRNEIRESFIGEEFTKTLSLAKKYLKELQKIHRTEYEDVRDDMFFCNYYIGFMYKKMGNYKQALYYTKLSIRYAIDDSSLNKGRWLLAACYENIHRINKAIENYKQCIKFYKVINQHRFRASIIFNIAKLLNKPNYMLKVIRILKKESNKLYKNELRNTDRESILKEAYIELGIYYKENNDIQGLFRLLHSIENETIKKELYNLLSLESTQIA